MEKRTEENIKQILTATNNKKLFVGMVLIALAAVFASVMIYTSYSNNATQEAVHNVSLFYLEELDTNVSQVFQSHFDGYFKELRLAMLSTAEADLESRTELVDHLADMAERGDFLYYALIDEEGNVYINDEAYLSDTLVSFLRECDFAGDEVTLEDIGRNEDIFIIAQAAPAEIVLGNGQRIVGGAKGIAESKVKSEILLRGENNDAFVHMIMSNGDYIIAGDNEKLVESFNYYEDLEKHAVFDDYSLETMKEEIAAGIDNSTAYNIDGELYYGYYSYLPRSGWSLVVTVPASTIVTTLNVAASGVTAGGIILMLVMMVLVSGVFLIYLQQKKVSVTLNIQRMEAEERNRAKSSFLSSMSHDIRTPMNAIIGFTNLALRQETSPQVKDYLNKISVSSNHLLNLINDVLDMSRIESGKMTIEEGECNLADLLHGLQTIILGQVNTKQQQLCVDAIDVVDENVWCDKMRLNQVLLNLLGNAVKFTPAGGKVSLLVRQNETDRPGYGAYEFHVKDTGIGMSKEFSKKLFEPFEREKSTTVNNIQGTGLGMSIAKNIVDMMGGTIRVETELGKGTEFIVTVELRLQEEPEKVLPAALKTLKGMRALVVDDDFNTCDSVAKMLHRLGMEADWTMSGREAVLRLKQSGELGKSYQVFIVDWQLPDMNGLELIRKIRESVGSETPILLVSSYSWNDVEGEAKQAGVTAFCSKPLFMSDLCRRLLDMISAPESSEEDVQEVVPERLEGKRILLAEDNELNQEIAVAVLEGYGFLVEVADNGQIAVEKLTHAAPGYFDAVLMDVQMPVMNGYEAAKAIRKLADPELAAIPILAMTANAFDEDRQNSAEAGMNGHITKPIDMNVLLETLKRHL